MTPTEVRKKLSQVKYLKKEIEVLDMRIEELRILAEGTSGFRTEFTGPTGCVESKVERLVLKIIEKSKLLEAKKMEMLRATDAADQLISTLPDKYSLQRTVLTLKYIVGKNISEVAKIVDYSERQVKRYEWAGCCIISKLCKTCP